MNNYYTFIVTSALNAQEGIYDTEQRLQQTLDTVASIRRHVENACVIFIDTENPRLTSYQQLVISSSVDCYVEYTPSLLENMLTQQYVSPILKTVGEYCLYDRALNFILEKDLVGQRVFKISARYRLTDSFDIAAYQNPVFDGKYVFAQNTWYIQKFTPTIHVLNFLETRLWSMCSSQVQDFKNKLPEFFSYTTKNNQGIELTFRELLDKNRVFVVPQIHVEGHLATNGQYVND